MGMGLGGPLGGFIADRCVSTLSSATSVDSTSLSSLGWRWAFLLQMPLFALSFVLTAWNLHYVTPVRQIFFLRVEDGLTARMALGKE